MGSATAITNLLYRYAELMDAGQLEEVAAMFSHARVTLSGGKVVEGAAPMLEQWRAFVRIHPCGTPRTRHSIASCVSTTGSSVMPSRTARRADSSRT